MKKGLSMCFSVLCAGLLSSSVTTAFAQIPQATGQQTTLYIDFTVEQQEITAGPYARYAQKYLGVTAPLADKVLHEVESVNMSEVSDLPANGGIVPNGEFSHMAPESGFPKLTVDKTSAIAMSLEESARLAAEKIFAIRKSRFDLVTGEVGENVFGGGLGSALEELDRLEEEYLSLFLGRQSTKTEFKQYRITPAKGSLTYTVCRFSETDGLLPEDDLSGEPVVLELKPTVDIPAGAGATTSQSRPSARAVPHFIPADMRCRIILNGAELASEQIGIIQLGETVYLPQ